MMELEQAARQSGVIPTDRVASLLTSLKKIPDCSWILTPPHPDQERLQGDVFADFPVCLVDDTGNPRCKKFAVLVLSNTCDLQPSRSSFVTVAPVMDFALFSESVIASKGADRAKNYLHDARANKIHEMLWLPGFAGFSDGAVVFLDRVGAVSAKLYEDALKERRRVVSFSQNGFYFLLIKLTNHIARMESDDVTRLAVN